MLISFSACTSCTGNGLLLLKGENEIWEVRIIDDELCLKYKGNKLDRKDSIEFFVKPSNSDEVLVKERRSLNEENVINTEVSESNTYRKKTPWIITIKWEKNIDTIEINPVR